MRALLLIALISVSMAGNSFAARALPRSIKDVPEAYAPCAES